VKPQQQSEREIWHVIVFSHDGTEVLLKIAESGFAFPAVEIPCWERLAENLTGALKKDWGCDALCLFALNDSSREDHSNGDHYGVMQCWNEVERTAKTVWKPLRSLTADSFQDKATFQTLGQSLHELDSYEHDPSSPFAQRGWITRLVGWAADLIRPLELEIGSSIRQYNASPSFSLIRLETNGPAVWFKAVGEPNLREFPITLKLAELFPRFIPEILGTKPEWCAWLAREIEGTNLGDRKELAWWEKAATGLASLQIESISKSDSILDSGAHDLRIDKLLNSVDPFLDLVARLMEEQPKEPPPTLSRQELGLLKLRIGDSLARLEDLRVPHTLGHLDLNPWNIVVSAGGCVFLDWSEAYVGHPFFSLEYLLQHFRRELSADAVLESEFVNAYKAPWRRLLSEQLMSEALALAPLAALFAYAAGAGTSKDEERLRNPRMRAYFRSLARRMNREAIRFIEPRSACLS
jgi:hypothetical protein